MENKLIRTKSTGFTSDLSIKWTDFVDCEKRLQTLSSFILKNMAYIERVPILDAALGIGCESIYLINRKFDVISNEISPELIEVAKGLARKNNCTLNITSFNWLDFNLHFDKYSFSNILLFGNSLCLLDTKEDIIKSIGNFYNILCEGGKLFVDERNFPYILKSKYEILNGNFKYKFQTIYCGRKIVGRPIHISNSEVIFGYFNKLDYCIGELKMIPFKKGELEGILHNIGFREIKTYSDLSIGYTSNADFYTYEAIK